MLAAKLSTTIAAGGIGTGVGPTVGAVVGDKVAAMQTRLWQCASTLQSLSLPHPPPMLQGTHEPPQSTSVSSPFRRLSAQEAEVGDAVGGDEGEVGTIDGALVGKFVVAEGTGVEVKTVAA